MRFPTALLKGWAFVALAAIAGCSDPMSPTDSFTTGVGTHANALGRHIAGGELSAPSDTTNVSGYALASGRRDPHGR